MGILIKQTACPLPGCGSSDAFTHYDNGSGYCFACHQSCGDVNDPVGTLGRPPGAGAASSSQSRGPNTYQLTPQQIYTTLPSGGLPVRGISAEVCAKYGVRIQYDTMSGQQQAAFYPQYSKSTRQLSGYQRKSLHQGRRAKGDVFNVGHVKKGEVLPFGAHIAGQRGKMIIVTEGAEDALAVVEMLHAVGKNYRVVATLGTDRWAEHIGYLEGFEKVVIAFDQDTEGREAAEELSRALSPSKGHIMSWTGARDPNDLLLSGKDGPKQFLDALYSSKPYQPSGIVWGDQVWDMMQNYVKPDYVPYPPEWPILAEKMEGPREAEISLWTAGSSIGKTSYLRRLKQHIVTSTNWKVGEVELEERLQKTARGMYQFVLGKRWHEATPEERRWAHEQTYGSGKLFAIDRGLRNKRDSLLTQFKHLHYSYGCNIIFLDHVTLGVREWGSGDGALGDQDSMMEELLEFSENTGVHIALVSHLRKPPGGGKSWSTGAVPTEEDMKGSGSLYQIAFDIIALSRNKMHEDPYERDVSQLHGLKCRETGRTGPADRIHWDAGAQRFEPALPPPDEGGQDDGDVPYF